MSLSRVDRPDDVVVQRQQRAPAADELFTVRSEFDAAALAARNQRVADDGLKPLHL